MLAESKYTISQPIYLSVNPSIGGCVKETVSVQLIVTDIVPMAMGTTLRQERERNTI